jgi:CcmD family protein
MKNLDFLFAAYSVVWLLFFGYMASISSRQKKLTQEIEALKRVLDEG